MIIEKIKSETGIDIHINDDNKLVIIPRTGDVAYLSKKDLNQLLYELNELAIKMK